MSTTSYEELTDTPDELRLYLQERAIEFVTAMICRLMKEKKINRSQLAERLNKTPGWVTQVLDGDKNKTIRTLSDLLWALEERLDFDHSPIPKVGAESARLNGRVFAHETYRQSARWPTSEPNESTSTISTQPLQPVG
jgi:transcriptional regulator with XRE-family HTH domain